ncbi:hypothetical protein CDL15_Pgr020417 [Punica granatum]|uniref:Uncharacterized protein n=1 Tax=Punica granatum TaxID=22663 RepID=A0A218VWK6_PUNGR|nr:hypothetical protein CDL15_Pgr020417 [Punica granatum]
MRKAVLIACVLLVFTHHLMFFPGPASVSARPLVQQEKDVAAYVPRTSCSKYRQIPCTPVKPPPKKCSSPFIRECPPP